MSSPERRGYVETDVGQIHYREAGAGNALILLHQTPSSSAQWERVVPYLSAHHRVIAMDTPGFGMSDRPADAPEDMGWYADCVAGFMDALGVERASLVGHHTGASVALELAGARPERVEQLVLVGLLALETDEEREYWYPLVKDVELDSRGAFLETYPLPVLELLFPSDDPEQFLLELIAALQAAPHYSWAYHALFRHEAYQRLARLEQRALFLNVMGDHEKFVESTAKAARHAPNAVYREVDGTIAMVGDDPAGFSHAVLEFLEGGPEPAAQ